MNYTQEPPFCIKLELTRGCNLQCDFCGINSIQASPKETKKFMSIETAKTIMDKIPFDWNPRFELTLRGEPTLNQNRNEIIAAIREGLPSASIMMTSNGGGLLSSPGAQQNLEAMFSSGLNILALDDYEHANIIPKIRAKACEFTLLDSGIKTYEYPEDKNGNPHRRTNKKFISFMKDLTTTTKGTHNHVCNHAGAAAPLEFSKESQRCHRPFRELVIRYNGNVDICCNSWTGDFTVGNIHDVESLDELWNHEALNAMRSVLYHDGRTMVPCLGCNAKVSRAGLLPDKLGKTAMPTVTPEDLELLEEYANEGREPEIMGRALNFIPVVEIL